MLEIIFCSEFMYILFDVGIMWLGLYMVAYKGAHPSETFISCAVIFISMFFISKTRKMLPKSDSKQFNRFAPSLKRIIFELTHSRRRTDRMCSNLDKLYGFGTNVKWEKLNNTDETISEGIYMALCVTEGKRVTIGPVIFKDSKWKIKDYDGHMGDLKIIAYSKETRRDIEKEIKNEGDQ